MWVEAKAESAIQAAPYIFPWHLDAVFQNHMLLFAGSEIPYKAIPKRDLKDGGCFYSTNSPGFRNAESISRDLMDDRFRGFL